MKKLVIVFLILCLAAGLTFVLGNYHFSDNYLIGKTLSVNTINQIDTRFWKNSGGHIDSYQSDLLDFKRGIHEIKNDTFYYKKKPVALATKLVHRCFIDYSVNPYKF